MASQIDFIIAVGIFILFTATIIVFLLNYISTYFSISSIADLRTVSYDTFNGIFSAPGIPSNWESSSSAPVSLGLITNLYEVPFVINETNGTARNNQTTNVSFSFDPNCQNKAWNTTVRIYDIYDNQLPAVLFNQTYCSGQYLKTADVIFNVSLPANGNATFFVFYSAQQQILPSSSSYSYPNVTNYTVIRYPEITLQTVSVDKLLALRKLDYNQIVQIISTNNKFYMEVGK
jgi:hypothetical protein